MRIYELSPRLQSVADLVPEGARLADVGTDHAYLPVWLILQGVIDGAVVSDLRQGPLDRARQNAAHYEVSDKLSFRLCDGLRGVQPHEADTVTIAGMGGETIANILSESPWVGLGSCRLILQPMTAQEFLRCWLSRHGYTIEREVLTQEGRTLYCTFLVRAGQMPPLSPAECWAGRQYPGMDAPLRSLYLERLVHRADRALDGIRRSTKPEDMSRAADLERVAAGLRAMKKEWEAWQR